MEKEKYIVEFTWGDNNPIHEEIEIRDGRYKLEFGSNR